MVSGEWLLNHNGQLIKRPFHIEASQQKDGYDEMVYRYAIRAQVSAWIASDEVQVVLITGGTGLTEGDQAPEALLPL
ncbi:hypothetical protein MJM45_28505, partial [Salmonella enterica subsp. enterica serovar Kentucky]|nr:hypothetical protein [Salmonella enterica subsp. enterica serovar Kentucky]